MKGKLLRSIFWALVGVFAVEMGIMFIGVPIFGRLAVGLSSALFSGIGVLFQLGVVGLGITLLILAIRAKVERKLKRFLILTGASATGIFVFAILSNLVYALFILWFGEGFWGAGGDEAFFFIMATMVCPLAFLVGAIGSIILGVKKSPSRRR